MVKIKTEPINASNTTLSLKAGRRHRKFDAKQAKRHDFGEAHCVVCDEVFTKYHNRTKVCSEECKKVNRSAWRRKDYAKNREKRQASQLKYREENLEKVRASDRKYYEKNREKILARERKYREENLEKVRAQERKYREENRDEINARKRERYHAKKKEE